MQDEIDFYLEFFQKISTLYTKKNLDEVIISQEIGEFLKKMSQYGDKTSLKNTLLYILSIFENYYLDEYNVSNGLDLSSLSNEEKHFFEKMLEEEILNDEYNQAPPVDLTHLTKSERELIIKTLKKELSKFI